MINRIILLGLSALLVFAGGLTHAVEENDILVYYSFDKLDGKTIRLTTLSFQSVKTVKLHWKHGYTSTIAQVIAVSYQLKP